MKEAATLSQLRFLEIWLHPNTRVGFSGVDGILLPCGKTAYSMVGFQPSFRAVLCQFVSTCSYVGVECQKHQKEDNPPETLGQDINIPVRMKLCWSGGKPT